MSTDDWRIAGLMLASFGGAAINAVAGGGSFLTFPALLWSGMTPIAANATSTVALWPGSLSSAWGYRREVVQVKPWLLPLSLVSAVGGWVGARLLLVTGDRTFTNLIPLLLGGSTLLLALQGRWLPKLQPLAAQTSAQTSEQAAVQAAVPTAALVGAQAAIAVYGGYFGGGMGILMLAAFAALGLRNLHVANGLKSVLGAGINGVAVVVFAASQQVAWSVALPMVLASLAGGYLGARMARRVRPALVRQVVVAVGALLTLWFAAETFSRSAT